MLDTASSGSPERTPVDGYLNFRAVLLARAAAQRTGLHHSLRHLLDVIAGYTGDFPAAPSYEELADATGLSVSRVRQYSYKLVNGGYLTRANLPAAGGGKGVPAWTLGPVCQSSTGGLPQGQKSTGGLLQKSTGGRSIVHQRSLAQAPLPRTPSPHVLPTTPIGGRPPLVAMMGGSQKKTEERTPLPPKPSKPKLVSPKAQKVADICDAVKAAGLPSPSVSGRDAQAINATTATAAEIAECWIAVGKGQWPTEERERSFWRNNRNLYYVVNNLSTYQQRAAQPAEAPRRAADVLRARRLQREQHPQPQP